MIDAESSLSRVSHISPLAMMRTDHARRPMFTAETAATAFRHQPANAALP